jgi:formamidopyrimidine-DNA glycosylase
MLELPESHVLAAQLQKAVARKKIRSVMAAFTPHKLAWYIGDPANYSALLVGKTISDASAYGGMVEAKADNSNILFWEGVSVRFHKPGESRPERHQLLIDFEDGAAISAAVQMYGGLGCFPEGELDNPYYRTARQKPSPLSSGFDNAYFALLLSDPAVQKLSAKALLATEQRIPGLGNGVLQDILFNAGIHPRKKVNTLSSADQKKLFASLKNTLSGMVKGGGRDTETDLYGRPGKYRTILSRKTVGTPCISCRTTIKKANYLGGSIYFCDKCQIL